jgi:protein TonB
MADRAPEAPTIGTHGPIPDGTGHPRPPHGIHPLSSRRGTTAVAALFAVALHLAAIAPLLWLVPVTRPPDMIVTVEIMPLPAPSTVEPSPERPVLEGTSSAAAAEPTRPVNAAFDAVARQAPETVARAMAAELTNLLPPPPEDMRLAEPGSAMAVPPGAERSPTASAEPTIADTPDDPPRPAMPPPDGTVAVTPTATPPRPVLQSANPPVPPTLHAPRPARVRLTARPAGQQRDGNRAAEAPTPAQPVTAHSISAPVAASPSDAIPTWRGELTSRLQRAKRYPDSARSNGQQGVAIATFTMDRAGHVLAALLVRSSGFPGLDEEAVALIRRAEPLPAMPDEMPGSTVTLTVPVAFSLR